MIRRCNARLRNGNRCRKPTVKNKLRCRLHGARAGRPPGIPLRASHNVALQRGRAAWAEGLGAKKAQGLIARFPGGSPPRGSQKDKTVARAERVLEDIAMAISRNRSLLPISTPDATAEGFFQAGGMSVDRVRTFLGPEINFKQLVDPEWLKDAEHRRIAVVILKAASLQANLAVSIINGQIKIAELRAPRPALDTYDAMLDRLGPAERPIGEILAEIEAEETSQPIQE